jgi:hypothetical protein
MSTILLEAVVYSKTGARLPDLSQGKMLRESIVTPNPIICFSDPTTNDTSSSYLICTLETLILTLSMSLLTIFMTNPGSSALGAGALSSDSVPVVRLSRVQIADHRCLRTNRDRIHADEGHETQNNISSIHETLESGRRLHLQRRT